MACAWTAKGLTSGRGLAASSGEYTAEDLSCGMFLQLCLRKCLLRIALDVLQRLQTCGKCSGYQAPPLVEHSPQNISGMPQKCTKQNPKYRILLTIGKPTSAGDTNETCQLGNRLPKRSAGRDCGIPGVHSTALTGCPTRSALAPTHYRLPCYQVG